MSTVPFGKYKGQPVEAMLADADYMRWLEAQPWFRERFAHFRRGEGREDMSRTPEHNKYQALFLSDGYCKAFFHAARPGREAEVLEFIARSHRKSAASIASHANDLRKQAAASRNYAANPPAQHPSWPPGWAEKQAQNSAECAIMYDERASEWERIGAPFLLGQHRPSVLYTAKFECEGADVRVFAAFKWNYAADSSHEPKTYGDEITENLNVEVKPIVSDDYPAVLRQMNRNKSQFLFVGSYEGEGASEEQFVEMFRRAGKLVVFKRDVDAAVGRRSP